jgi:hypothetical protein
VSGSDLFLILVKLKNPLRISSKTPKRDTHNIQEKQRRRRRRSHLKCVWTFVLRWQEKEKNTMGPF